jgi:Ca-activated chloride channel homolog
MRSLRLRPAFLLTCVLLWAVAALPQEPEVHIRPREQPRPAADAALDTHTPSIKSDVDLVLVPVTVTDPDNRLVTGLGKEHFEVEEDKRPQPIHTLSAEDAPVSLGVIFDMSGSMNDKMEKAREAVVEFLQAGNPADEFFVIGFSDKPELVSEFTTETGTVRSKLALTQAKGMTSMLDAVYLGLNEMKHARYQRKALLIISDGGDNHSRYSESEIKSVVKEADVQLFAIGLFDMTPRTEEERRGPVMLSELTDVTGGRTFTIDNPNQLPDVAAKIGIAIRNQYVIAYRSTTKPRDGKWHKIRVKLHPPKGLPPLHVQAKTGYYAAGR